MISDFRLQAEQKENKTMPKSMESKTKNKDASQKALAFEQPISYDIAHHCLDFFYLSLFILKCNACGC